MIGVILATFVILTIAYRIGRLFHQGAERALVPSITFIVISVYFTGLFGNLRAGIIFLLFLSLLILSISAYRSIKTADNSSRKHLPDILQDSRGIVFFIIMSLGFTIIYHGMLSWGWDEFSHWSDIVKVMTQTHHFGSSDTQSLFASYIPGVPVFEYFYQTLNNLVYLSNNYTEGLTYTAYHILIVIILSVFFEKSQGRKFLNAILLITCILTLPLILFEDFYNYVYIDPVIGILSGTSLSYIMLADHDDALYDLNVFSFIVLLTMSKNIGIWFALCCALLYVCFNILKKRKRLFVRIGIATLSIVIPFISWKEYIKINGIRKNFGGKIDFHNLFEIITGKDTSYRSEVFKTFISNFRYAKISLYKIGLHIDYIWFVIICILIVAILLYKYKKEDKLIILFAVFVLFLQTCVYIFGTCVSYMFLFSESEALSLASFVRYMSVAFLSIFEVLILTIFNALNDSERRKSLIIGLILALIIMPLTPLINLVRGEVKAESNEFRSYYSSNVLTERISELPENSRIYFISQGNNGIDYWVMKYSTRPRSFNGNFEWSITKDSPSLYDRMISEEEIRSELAEKYDYVLVFRSDERLQTYTLFNVKPEDNTIYRVDTQTGMLIQLSH